MGAETSCPLDKAQFWQMLTEGVCEGQPLGTLLHSISQKLPAESFGKVAGDLLDSINTDLTLSDAMRQQPSVFSKAHVNLVEAGEMLGILDRTLLLILESTWRCPTCGNL